MKLNMKYLLIYIVVISSIIHEILGCLGWLFGAACVKRCCRVRRQKQYQRATERRADQSMRELTNKVEQARLEQQRQQKQVIKAQQAMQVTMLQQKKEEQRRRKEQERIENQRKIIEQQRVKAEEQAKLNYENFKKQTQQNLIIINKIQKAAQQRKEQEKKELEERTKNIYQVQIIIQNKTYNHFELVLNFHNTYYIQMIQYIHKVCQVQTGVNSKETEQIIESQEIKQINKMEIFCQIMINIENASWKKYIYYWKYDICVIAFN